MARLAILAGQGALPHHLAAAYPDAVFAHFFGLDVDLPGNDTLQLSYERFGEMFDALEAAHVTEIVFAGSLERPVLNPGNFDAKMQQLAPGLMAAMQGGDDGLLRAVIRTFEDEGFVVRGAHELIGSLTAKAGVLSGPPPSQSDLSDIARARSILEVLGPLDVGQAVVVADGQVLGVETVQGTDAMLGFVTDTVRQRQASNQGVLVKRPKLGQDLRVDMPAIGPETVKAALAARLSGIAIAADTVLILDRDMTLAAADRAGMFILAEPD